MTELPRRDHERIMYRSFPPMPTRTEADARTEWKRYGRPLYEREVSFETWLASELAQVTDFPVDGYTWHGYAGQLWRDLHQERQAHADLQRSVDGDALYVYRRALDQIARETTDPRAAEIALRAALDITQAALDKARLAEQAQKASTPEVQP